MGCRKDQVNDELFSNKFKELMATFEPTQDTQLLKYVFTSACLVVEDSECIEIARSKLQICSNDLKFMTFFLMTPEQLKVEWETAGHKAYDRRKFL